MKSKEQLKEIAKEIARLEQNISLDKDIESAEQKIEDIMFSLSTPDLMELIDLIQEEMGTKNHKDF